MTLRQIRTGEPHPRKDRYCILAVRHGALSFTAFQACTTPNTSSKTLLFRVITPVNSLRHHGWNGGKLGGMRSCINSHVILEDRFDLTQYKTIYGRARIGSHWMVCKIQKSGERQPRVSLVLDWQDNNARDASYAKFRAIADHVYNIV